MSPERSGACPLFDPRFLIGSCSLLDSDRHVALKVFASTCQHPNRGEETRPHEPISNANCPQFVSRLDNRVFIDSFIPAIRSPEARRKTRLKNLALLLLSASSCGAPQLWRAGNQMRSCARRLLSSYVAPTQHGYTRLPRLRDWIYAFPHHP